MTTKIIKCQLFSLNIVCSICFFIKQVSLHLKCSVSSTVTKFEHCHYIRCGDTAQYSKVSLSAVSASGDRFTKGRKCTLKSYDRFTNS